MLFTFAGCAQVDNAGRGLVGKVSELGAPESLKSPQDDSINGASEPCTAYP